VTEYFYGEAKADTVSILDLIKTGVESPQVPSKGGKVTAGWAIPGCCSLSLDDSRERLQLIRDGLSGVRHQLILS